MTDYKMVFQTSMTIPQIGCKLSPLYPKIERTTGRITNRKLRNCNLEDLEVI